MCPVLRTWPHSYAGFFADTEAFLMKNAKVKLCLQASPMNGDLLLEDCNPESDFQDWSWQGDSLMNHGTQSCLSMVGANRVQTSLCSSAGYTSWDCSNSLLSPLGSSQGYLVANRKGVALNSVGGLKAQWQDVADRSVCEEKAGKCRTPGDQWYMHTHCWGMWKGTFSVLGSFQPWVPHLGSAVQARNALHFSVYEIRLYPHGCILPAWRDVLGNPWSQGEGHFWPKVLQ